MAIIAEKLSVANYNKLDNIPVINQDLSATDFTPVANTYYRHTGATTATFTQGVIYLYDTAYHKLGESGGTTLNKYTVSKPSIDLFAKIYLNAKGNVSGAFGINIDNTLDHGFPIGAIRPSGSDTIRATICNGVGSGSTKIYVGEILIRSMNSSPYIDSSYSTVFRISADSITKVEVGMYNADYSKIVYYNDTEITL